MVLCQHYLVSFTQVKHLLQKTLNFANELLSTLSITCVLNKLTFLSQNWYLFQKGGSSLEEQRAKESFQTNLVIKFGYFLIVSLKFESPKVKRYLITNLVNELLHELPNDLRLRIFGNQRHLKKGKYGERRSLVPSLPFRD